MRNAVFDATTLVSAFLTKQGVSAQLLEHAVAGAFELYLSDAIIEETRDVLLHRAHLRNRFVYTDQDVEEFCLLLRAFARNVSNLPAVQVSRDPTDDYVIATAVAAGVSFLVTRGQGLINAQDLPRRADDSPRGVYCPWPAGNPEVVAEDAGFVCTSQLHLLLCSALWQK